MAIGLLTALVVVLIAYNAFIQRQLRNINRQLDKRLNEQTQQPLSLELINPQLNQLTANINRCLKAEENLRLDSIREEKRFKELIANISHDLRTPLTAIKGYLQLIEKKESDDQRQKLQIAQKHATDLGALIEHFFEYSYLLNADHEPYLERINLTNLVTECLADSIAAFEEKHLTVRIEECAAVFAFTDKLMVMRIIKNLIRNGAVHADGEVEVKIQSEQNAVVLFKNHVKSTSKLDVNRLFERFYTADQARSRTTGLGLSIVKLLAEQLGGNASASLQDEFLEVRVELPVLEGEA